MGRGYLPEFPPIRGKEKMYRVSLDLGAAAQVAVDHASDGGRSVCVVSPRSRQSTSLSLNWAMGSRARNGRRREGMPSSVGLRTGEFLEHDGVSGGLQPREEQLALGGFAGAVEAFDCD